MIARLADLRTHPSVFRHPTGLTVPAFDAPAADVAPAVEAAHRHSLDRPDRQRAVGAGGGFGRTTADQVLMAVVWLRQYPTQEVLGFPFGGPDSTALRAVRRCLPALERAGRDAMRMPDPGPGRRKKLPALLADTPGSAVVTDAFGQRTHRPKRRPRAYYSGKTKAHTLKSQVGVGEESGRIADVSDSAPGPWADLKLLKASRLPMRWPEGVGGIGDLAYVGIAGLHPEGPGASPRRKPRGRERPPEDRAYDRAFGRRRIVVEHTIGRLRRSPSHVNRHGRKGHAARVRAVAGLVNRTLPTPTT